MFRLLTVIFLVTGFSAQTFNLGWLVLDYSANKASYQRNCKNKQVPESQCHGKCQFFKKVKTEQEKEQQFPESKGAYKVDFTCCKSEFAVPQFAGTGDILIKHSIYLFSFPPPAAFDIFHPPA